MKRILIGLALAAAPLALSGCYYDGYYGLDAGYGYGWYSYPYSVWYDGYYGPLYDGYWGTDGYFYYRGHSHDHDYYRGDGSHFYHDRPPGGGYYHHYDGHSRHPQPGGHMPNYPSSGAHYQGGHGGHGGHSGHSGRTGH